MARLEDPAEAVVQMSAKINEYATGGDDYEEYSAITTMQKLLENGTFELTFDLVIDPDLDPCSRLFNFCDHKVPFVV